MLTHHIRENLQVWPGPFPGFSVGTRLLASLFRNTWRQPTVRLAIQFHQC